jgi:hypothetical protein
MRNKQIRRVLKIIKRNQQLHCVRNLIKRVEQLHSIGKRNKARRYFLYVIAKGFRSRKKKIKLRFL